MKRLLVFMAAFSTTVRAVNTIEREFTCPLDQHKFKQRIETSAQPTGVRLDLKRLGEVVEPATLPQCPKCHFVIFMDKWTDTLVAELGPFVRGADFQLIAAKSPSYFCLAQIQDFLRAPAHYVGQSYLRASWQVEEKEALRDRCLTLALERFSTALTAMKPGDAEYVNTALLCGEIERRLKKWDAASARFRNLRDDPQTTQPSQRAVIERQMALIEMQDSGPHSAAKDEKPAAPEAKDAVPESPAPASLKEASAKGGEPGAEVVTAKIFPDLPPVMEGFDDVELDLPELPFVGEYFHGIIVEALPEPRILKAPRKSTPLPRVASKKQKPAAKPAVMAAPDGKARGRRLIGMQEPKS